ncbi:uncharacterized protein RJT21DRAFT_50599 [Scheffersomyces amazonensis]|uniref:uncharacterized protein n=1 Tax=Scheffersomyces amazonensis TaxID=1078765 RepID=UPI00315CEE9C
MATAKYNPNKLPDLIKIDDITSGKIDPQLIYQELNRLKVELNILRNDMNNFLRVLIDIPTNANGDVNEHEYFKVIASRLKTLKETINEYCLEYNKLLPIINLAQIKLGHEVEILPPPTSNRPSVAGGLVNTITATNTPTIPATNISTPSTTTGATPTATATTPAINSNTNTKRNSVTKSGPNKPGANVNQPIVI